MLPQSCGDSRLIDEGARSRYSPGAHNTRTSGQPKTEICLADWFESFPTSRAALVVPAISLREQLGITIRDLDIRVDQNLCQLGQVPHTIRLDLR